ncbi:hypothetical protein [Promicromonospora sp. NPDC050880]|uniref:hypothetical protein n=1 Tax=Promicromonospora sp. NPDC050880 TaxID=3364406 RepID=UPI0037A2E88D
MSEPTTEAGPVVEQTSADFFDSLTGYDEHAIRKAFDGAVVGKLGKEDPIRWMRALAFIHFRRTGEGDPLRKANELRVGELTNGFFAEDDTDTPMQRMQRALADVLDAEDLADAKAAVRKAMNPTGGGASGEAR